jgi:hypothetical protein
MTIKRPRDSTTPQYSQIFSNKDIDDVIRDFNDAVPDEDDEITKKIYVVNIDKTMEPIDDSPYVTIYVLKCKQEYEEFYPCGIHPIIFKEETQFSWYGYIVSQDVHQETIEWCKQVWEKILDFKVSTNIIKKFDDKLI